MNVTFYFQKTPERAENDSWALQIVAVEELLKWVVPSSFCLQNISKAFLLKITHVIVENYKFYHTKLFSKFAD